MYCLEKLQRELAYFFDMDLRELPRVQDLLKQKGYTQIQKGDEIITLEPSTPNQKTPYTDTQGHTHQIPTDIAQKWLESFGLKDLQESYTPKFSEQVAQALEPILQGEQITLSANSLVKLIQRDRAEFLPYIKETLETPNAVVRQVDGAIIFAKDYRDEKLGKFFASVSKNDNGEWVISSNAPKNLNNLQNKIKEGGEVLYSDLPELPIIAKPDLTAKALNSEANLSDIIPHTAQEKPKWSKADQKAWKAAKLAETRAKAQELQAKLQPIYDEVRPIIIEAQNIAKTKNLEKNAAAKEKYDELHKKAHQIATPKLEQFYPELEKHGLETSLKDFFRHPETAQIQVTPMQNSNLKWKNKERGEQGLKGSAKYREQALEKLSEKSYIDRLEPATKAENPLTQLHGLKYEILKDLHKAKRYAKQGGTSYETYTRYASRASDELDIIEQAIRELKNAIVPKPKRAEQVRSKVQDFIKWRDEVRFDVDYLLGLESDGTRHALEYLRDLPTPTKHHASFVKDLQEQIHKHFDTDPTPPTPPSTPTPADTPKVDSSEIKELSTKTTSKLTKEQLEALPLATPQEYGEFLEKIAQKDYQNAPEILKIATLNNNLQELINNNHSAGVFITRARVGHISEARKSEYGQALTLEEQKQIPEVIAQAKEAYADDKSGFIIPFADKNNGEKINLIILDSDNKGNFLITAKKVNSAELSNPKYKKLARAGVEPATTTPPLKTEQKPTEAISPASDEIIPQPTPQNFIKDFETNNPDIIKTLKNIQSFEPLYHYKESMKLLESYASQIIATEHPLIKGYLKELELQFTNYIQALANQRITGGFLGTHTYSQAQAHTNTTQKYSQALKNMDDLIKAARKKDYIFNTLNASDNALVFTTATSTGEPRVAIRLTSQDYKLQKSLKKLKISYNPNYNQYQTTIENYHARKEAIQDLLDLQLPEISKAEQDNIKQQAKAHSKALHKTNPFEQAIGDNVEKTAKTAPASDSTKGADLSLNSSEIMPPTTQTPTTQKGLFDEADSSATTPPQKEPTQKGKTDFNMLVLESWSKDNEYLRDILDFIKANPLAQKIDSQFTEKWGYDSDVPPLVVFDSALLLKDKEAFLQTKDPLTPKQMQRFREKAERHFAVAQKYGLDLDGFYDFAREWRKVVNNYQNYGHTNRKKIETSLDSSTPTPQATPKADSNALLKSAMKKFAYDEKKAKDLLEWHKDSSPLTKDENGLPKVFYHGTSSDKVFEVFNKDKIHSGYGFWFGDDIADRAVKENTTGKAPIIKAFLQMKKPFIFSNQGITAQNIDEYAYITGISKKRITELYEAKEAFNTLEKMIQRDTQADYVWAGAVDYFEIEKGGKELNIFDYRQLDLSDQTIAFLDRMRTKGITARGIDISPTRQYESAQEARETLERLKEKGYDSMVYANSEFVVFDSNQIKHIENRGVESESGRKYFNDSSPNIFHSNPHLGAGLLGGSVAGVEQDENGQWRFSPEKFALGLLGSTAGSKAVAKGLEWRARKVAKSYPNIAKDNPQLMREIAKRDLHTYATASTHNALSRFLHNNKLFDINPQLFAGEKALANEAYAPHKARLENAKELEAKGAKEIEIWEQTGWYKDKDQRWKFEISQRGGELLTKDEFGRPYKRAFLSKILQDDELFNAYPKLENILVIEDKKLGRGVNASYDPKLKDIYIKNLQAKEAKISLYHELQHAIQDIEGFAYGFKDYVTSDENFHKYAIQHGEVEARNVESRMNLPTKKDVQILKRAAKNTDKNIEDLKTSDYEEWYKNERINTEQSKKKDFLAKAQAAQEVINQGKYTDHPHKTMDTPLENTIAEATMHGEALSKKLGDKAGDTLKSTQKVQGESKEMQQQLQSTIQTHLENLPPNPTPQPINEAKIKALIKRFDNIENLQEHLNTRADTKARQEIFSLLDDTLQTPQVHYKKDGKDKYLKRYKSERKAYFYLLVTKDENKTFITHFKTRDSKYLSKEITKAQEIIQGADIIEALSQRTGDI